MLNNHKFISVIVSCGLLSINNGTIDYNSPQCIINGRCPFETISTFTCDYGFILSGPDSRSCEIPGNWDEHNATCTQSNISNILKL